ncbi:MAG TPA: ATP-binding cassette domain-containing protein [Candidatus Obscuribacterales bacterium]
MTTAVTPSAALPQSDVVVSVRNLTKEYDGQAALKGISFEIRRGEIFGLIGPDGAGKTTTFHILGGIMDQTSGEAFALGTVPRHVRLQIGYLTQVFSLYLDLSVNENIEYAARIREVPEKDYKARRQKYLKLMDLYQFGDRLAGELSGGMKQKLALCCALIARPQVLLLDEPTTGVDPVSRRDFWDVLASIASEGVTVAVATPYLDEAERCNRVALMHKGEIYQSGTPDALKKGLHLRRLAVRARQLQSLVESLTATAREKPAATIDDVQQFGDRLDVLVREPAAAAEEIRLRAASLQIAPISVEEQEPTLENVFVKSLRGSVAVAGEPFPFTGKAAPPEGQAISANKISKLFGHFRAVDRVSLEVNYGEIYGLLGANGAGKTTTIKMLCGLLDASEGEIALGGRKANLRGLELRRQIGYMSQKFVLYDDLTVMENLAFYCGTYRIPARQRAERLAWAISTFELAGYEGSLTGALPGGWKQKLSFAASVLHQPSIIFLDEPTSGVDPLARRQLWSYIRQFAEAGAAVLVTTHFLEEAEHCQRLGFMAAGELVAEGTPSEIKQREPGQLIELSVDQLQRAYEHLRKVMEPWRTSIFGSQLHVVLSDPERDRQRVHQALSEAGIAIRFDRDIPFSLEDAFIGISQRARGAA